MGHLGTGEGRSSQLRRFGGWLHVGCKFGIFRPRRPSEYRAIDPARSACHFVSWPSRQTLLPRAGKLATGLSSRSKFSSGAAAPRSLDSSNAARRQRRSRISVANKILDSEPHRSIAWERSTHCCRIFSSVRSSPAAKAARAVSVAMQHCSGAHIQRHA